MELFLNILLVILVLLLLVSLWKAVGILDQLNSNIKRALKDIDQIKSCTTSASEKIGNLQDGVNDFAKELGPFFAGGRELIDDILRNKREAEAANKQAQQSS